MNSIEISLQDVSRILRELKEDPIQQYSTPLAEEEICTPYDSECEESDGEEEYTSEEESIDEEDEYDCSQNIIAYYPYIPPTYNLIFHMYTLFMKNRNSF
jgi:hypothetical protein